MKYKIREIEAKLEENLCLSLTNYRKTIIKY